MQESNFQNILQGYSDKIFVILLCWNLTGKQTWRVASVKFYYSERLTGGLHKGTQQTRNSETTGGIGKWQYPVKKKPRQQKLASEHQLCNIYSLINLLDEIKSPAMYLLGLNQLISFYILEINCNFWLLTK